jgi:hypothetical protein
VNSTFPVYERPVEAMLVALSISIRARLRRDLAALPPNVEVIVLEQSGVEDVDWQDFSHTDAFLQRGYLDARAVLDELDPELVAPAHGRTRRRTRGDGRSPRTGRS